MRNDRLPFFLKDLVAFLMASTARVHMAQPKRNAADDSLLDGFYEILGLAPKTIELHRAKHQHLPYAGRIRLPLNFPMKGVGEENTQFVGVSVAAVTLPQSHRLR